MPFQLQWSIEGDTQLSRRLIGLQGSLTDYHRPFGEAASYLKATFSRDVFDTQGAAIGERWTRLSPYTVAQKARKGYPATPLIGTGSMRNNFQTIVSSDQAVVYNTAAYFKYHQSKAARSSNLPRRVMMKLADRQKEQIVKYFQEHIQAALHRP